MLMRFGGMGGYWIKGLEIKRAIDYAREKELLLINL